MSNTDSNTVTPLGTPFLRTTHGHAMVQPQRHSSKVVHIIFILLQRPPAGVTAASGHRYERAVIDRWGGVGQFFLGESQSRLYLHMRAKFGRGRSFRKKARLNL